MPFNTTFLTVIKNEIDTDPTALGYSGKTAGEILTLLNTKVSQDPQVFTASPISPQEVALILIRQNKWKAVKDATATNVMAFSLVELAALPGLDVDWTGTELVALLTNLVTNGIITTTETNLIRDASRVEVLTSRREDLGWPVLNTQDIQEAIDLI